MMMLSSSRLKEPHNDGLPSLPSYVGFLKDGTVSSSSGSSATDRTTTGSENSLEDSDPRSLSPGGFISGLAEDSISLLPEQGGNRMQELMMCTQLHAQRLPILSSLLQKDLDECRAEAEKTNTVGQEYEARHQALLQEHTKAVQLTFDLIDEKVRLSHTIPTLVNELSGQLQRTSESALRYLEGEEAVEQEKLVALRSCLTASESSFVSRDVLQFERRALELKFKILEQESEFLRDRIALLQQAQADVVQKFNAVAQAQTLTSTLIEQTKQLSSAVTSGSNEALADVRARVCSQIEETTEQLKPLIEPLVGQPDQTVNLLCQILPKDVLQSKMMSKQGGGGSSKTSVSGSGSSSSGSGSGGSGTSLIGKNKSEETEAYRSVPALITRLTDGNITDSTFQKHLLMTYRYFLTPVAFVRLLILRFLATPPPGLESSEAYVQEQKPVQLRTLATLKVWIDTYPEHFQDTSALSPTPDLLRFLTSTAVVHYHKVAARMLQKLEVIGTRGSASSTRGVGRGPAGGVAPPLALLHPSFINEPALMEQFDRSALFTIVSPLEFARQVSLYLSEIYASVKSGEFFGLAWSKAGKEQKAPNLMKLIQEFNGLSAMVVTSIVECQDIDVRVRRLEYFTNVAIECSRLNNLHATVSVVSGLQSTPVFRLKRTWQALPNELVAMVHDLIALLRDNSKLLRDRVATVTHPCIPYIGVYLTDLTFLDEGNPTFHEGLVNFRKCRMIASRIDEFLRFAIYPYPFESVNVIRSWITDYSHNLSPAAAHQLSDRVEPKRDSTLQSSTSLELRKQSSRRRL